MQIKKNYHRVSTVVLATVFFVIPLRGQVTIGEAVNPQSFSLLEISTAIKDGGLRMPQLTTQQREDLALDILSGQVATEAKGLVIYNIDTKCLEFWNGDKWVSLCKGSDPCEGLEDSYTNCIGTTLADINPRVEWYAGATGGAPLPTNDSLSVGTTTYYAGNCDNATARKAVSITIYNCSFSPINCGISLSPGTSATFIAIPDPNAEAYEFFVDDVSQGRQPTNTLILASAVNVSSITVSYHYPAAFLKPKMIAVQGGTFMYRSQTQPASDGTPASPATAGYTTTLSDFYMSETLVTQAQYEAVMGVNPSYYKCSSGVNLEPSSSKPVDTLNWYGAIAFCNKLSIIEGRTPVYSVKEANGVEVDWANLPFGDIPDLNVADPRWDAATQDLSANGYRLPTDAEWEYAARGGQLSNAITTTGATLDFYYSGNDTIDLVAWYVVNRGSNGPAAVKQKKANALGLYDMSGNMWEWCWDWYSGNYTNNTFDPTGQTSGTDRTYRGGSWYRDASSSRVTSKAGSPQFRPFGGFRLVYRAN